MKMKLSIALVFLTCVFSIDAYTTLNNNDMFPIFSSQSHFDLMNVEQKEKLKDTDERGILERIQFSTSMVAQKATHARNLDKIKVLVGDVHGRLNMIGLTYGSIPTGQTQPALLATAAAKTLSTVSGATIGDDTYSDIKQKFGFFSLPVKYHKIGARFNVQFRILDDFVLTFQTGVVDMKQTLTHYTDKTLTANVGDVFTGVTSADIGTGDSDPVETNLMDKRTAIFAQMGVNGEDWNKTGVEDVSLGLAWRHNFRINKDADPKDWAHFIFTPFFRIIGSFGTGRAEDPDILLSLPFGNNKHDAIHGSAGFSIDFNESIEMSFEGGATHYFDRTYITRVPTHRLQSLLFPYKTTIKNEPGKTWHLCIGLNARNFLDRLSMYANYSYVQHGQDTITLPTANSAFLPARLADQTGYKVQMATIGFNYDLSPNMTCGFSWQAPLVQRGSYKTTTILLSGSVTF
jgi:hypothetical protein